MKSTAKFKQKALIIGGAVLIIMAVSLLFLIRRPASIPAPSPTPRHHGAATADPEKPGRSSPAGAGRTSGRTYQRTSTPTVAAPAASASDAGPRASNNGLTPRVARKHVPGQVQADAPPVVPSEIQQERDPARKARLMKMHKVAMARVKVSQLRRRQRLLRSTLSRSGQDGSLSPERLKRAQQDLRDLDTGIVDAKKALEQAQVAAGE